MYIQGVYEWLKIDSVNVARNRAYSLSNKSYTVVPSQHTVNVMLQCKMISNLDSGDRTS